MLKNKQKLIAILGTIIIGAFIFSSILEKQYNDMVISKQEETLSNQQKQIDILIDQVSTLKDKGESDARTIHDLTIISTSSQNTIDELKDKMIKKGWYR